jgi:hypothetical protein
MWTKKEFIKKVDSFREFLGLTTQFNSFVLILAFVISIPTLKSSLARWIFVLVTLSIILNILFTQLDIIFSKETNIAKLIRENKETISDLKQDIEILQRRLKKKQDLKKKTNTKEVIKI